MSNAYEITDLFNDKLNDAMSRKVAKVVKERLSEKDPTIDWTLVKVVSDYKMEQFYFEAEDPSIEAKIRAAYALVKADQSEKPLP